jgi:membrane fusion protein (multidrug efflux system)
MTSSLACLAAVLLLALSSVSANAQQPTVAPPAVLVQTAELRALARQEEFVGRADALEKVDVRARVRGFLGPRLFQDGDLVKKDQVIFSIEKDPFEAAVEQRKALFVSAEATLTKCRSAITAWA